MTWRRWPGWRARLLDDAGLADARIFASGGLDEYAIADLVAAGAPIDAYGVGTKMGVSADAPYLDSAYKLVAYAGRPVMKLSPGKVTQPGAKQVYRGPAVTSSRCATSPRRPATSPSSSRSCATAGASPRPSRWPPPSSGARRPGLAAAGGAGAPGSDAGARPDQRSPHDPSGQGNT